MSGAPAARNPSPIPSSFLPLLTLLSFSLLRDACCMLRHAQCVLRNACCVLRLAWSELRGAHNCCGIFALLFEKKRGRGKKTKWERRKCDLPQREERSEEVWGGGRKGNGKRAAGARTHLRGQRRCAREAGCTIKRTRNVLSKASQSSLSWRACLLLAASLAHQRDSRAAVLALLALVSHASVTACLRGMNTAICSKM